MTRWTPRDVAEYDRRTRSANGFVAVAPNLVRRGQHKSAYLYHACAYARAIKIAEPVAEHYFDDDREWRFDLAWPDAKVAIEITGGLHINGAHVRGAYVAGQHEKWNAATLAGWRVLFGEPRDLASAIQMAARLLG